MRFRQKRNSAKRQCWVQNRIRSIGIWGGSNVWRLLVCAAGDGPLCCATGTTEAKSRIPSIPFFGNPENERVVQANVPTTQDWPLILFVPSAKIPVGGHHPSLNAFTC